jgi:hypothetical protein
VHSQTDYINNYINPIANIISDPMKRLPL